MTSLIPILAACGAAAAAALIRYFLKKRNIPIPGIFLYLTFVLPFAAGGFHSYVSMITAWLLTAELIRTVRRNKKLRFVFSFPAEAVLFLVLCYCAAPLWAADKGMAAFAVVRYLPVGLYLLVWMQYSPEEKKIAMGLVPWCGAAMTLVTCALLPIPEMQPHITVNGRLSGFFQYPNTFAAFLLAGLILSQTREIRQRADLLADAVLILGIVLSGSRTVFVLLMAALIGILWIRRSRKLLLSLGISLGAGLLLALLASQLGLLRNADRFTAISTSSGSFLVRLLYFKDALPVILKNPFGLGYLGYRAMEGTFQTGRYGVTFIHNGLLQMLLDVGWAPALLMAAVFLRAMLSKKTEPGKRLLLVILLGHCMMDFDLQFFSFWVVLLSAVDFESGSVYYLKKQKSLGIAACAVVLAVCTWLGTGDLLHSLGKTEACLRVTPFHTDALTSALQRTADPEALDALADRILKNNKTHSLAYSAKANAAFARGQVVDMMTYKEQAILCARYSTEDYADYFEKLYAIYLRYQEMGDSTSAGYCLQKLQTIPEMMAQVSGGTDSLAHLTGEDQVLQLPDTYLTILQMLEAE